MGLHVSSLSVVCSFTRRLYPYPRTPKNEKNLSDIPSILSSILSDAFGVFNACKAHDGFTVW